MSGAAAARLGLQNLEGRSHSAMAREIRTSAIGLVAPDGSLSVSLTSPSNLGPNWPSWTRTLACSTHSACDCCLMTINSLATHCSQSFKASNGSLSTVREVGWTDDEGQVCGYADGRIQMTC